MHLFLAIDSIGTYSSYMQPLEYHSTPPILHRIQTTASMAPIGKIFVFFTIEKN